MPVADTSLEAYRAHSVRDLSAGQARVMACIRPGLDFTRAEIAHASGMALQSVRRPPGGRPAPPLFPHRQRIKTRPAAIQAAGAPVTPPERFQ